MQCVRGAGARPAAMGRSSPGERQLTALVPANAVRETACSAHFLSACACPPAVQIPLGMLCLQLLSLACCHIGRKIGRQPKAASQCTFHRPPAPIAAPLAEAAAAAPLAMPAPSGLLRPLACWSPQQTAQLLVSCGRRTARQMRSSAWAPLACHSCRCWMPEAPQGWPPWQSS